MLRALSTLGLLLTLASACEPAQKGPAPSAPASVVVALAGKTMGTTYSVKLKVPASKREAATALQADIDAALERVNDQMSTYRPKSELSRFNQHQSTEPFAVSPATAQVVGLALEIAEKTHGAFDVTLGPVINLWGFDRDGRKSAPPSEAALRAARARVGYKMLHAQKAALVKDRKDLDVNLSGIAKGYGVDVVAELLASRGYTDFMVEIGGEVRAQGTNGAGVPWRIGINTPRSNEDPTSIVTAISLRDQALATSGDYRNFFESGGVRYSHIIDPKTGAPVPHHLVSVSVLGQRCAQVDALATAFLVMGEAAAREVISTLDGVSALFIHVDKGTGALKISRTAGFPTE